MLLFHLIVSKLFFVILLKASLLYLVLTTFMLFFTVFVLSRFLGPLLIILIMHFTLLAYYTNIFVRLLNILLVFLFTFFDK